MTLQPLLFVPRFHVRVWGGRRLESALGRTLPDAQPYGESWELVDRAEDQSVVESGPLAGLTLHDLWTNHRAEVFGLSAVQEASPRFPLLIKVLDCADDLSVQVHPPAAVAPQLGGEPKTEVWFVAGVDDGAKMYAGLKRGVNRASFEQALSNGTVADCVHTLHPLPGDSLFVQSGRLHALGGGLLIYEIQQNSDTTYRVFDWNRVGLDGKPRDLHVAESMACIDFDDVEPALAHGDEIARCDLFTVTRSSDAVGGSDRARLLMAITPTTVAGVTAAPGRVMLLPPSLASEQPSGEWLEITWS